MATTIQYRTQRNPLNAPVVFHGWDPFRLMDQLLRTETAPQKVERTPFAPRFDVKETAESFTFHADLPGVKESDVDIALNGSRLTISGKRELAQPKEAPKEGQTQSENYFLTERSYGSFSRSFTLPESADFEKVGAELKDGVLTVVVPKRAASQPRKVTLNTQGAAPKDRS